MKFARFAVNGNHYEGIIEGDSIRRIAGGMFWGYSRTDETWPLADVSLLAPAVPRTICCVGLNYNDHIDEMGHEVPSEPVIFLKPPTTLIGPGAPIVYPDWMSQRVDYECELVIVIGKTAKRVKREEAYDYIFGYTCGNDVTARDVQSRSSQWAVAKGCDTFMPLGPWIETELDPNNVGIKTVHNGKTVQSSHTKHLIFKPDVLLEYITSAITLHPGDVIMTGTPSGIAPVAKGDTIEIVVDGIGTLTNNVV